MSEERSDEKPIWEYTKRIRDHARASPHGSTIGGPYGSYMGRHIIGRDSRILDGIDFDVGHRHEMVVVSHTDPDLPKAYEDLTAEIGRRNPNGALAVLRIVYQVVRAAIPYDYFGKLRLVRKMGRGKNECKLPLALFVRHRVGVCREQGLLAGYLIERLIDDGIVRGTVSVDRSIQRLRWWETVVDALVYREWSAYGGHEWARHTAPDGTIYVVDVAQGYCGPLWGNQAGWHYARPTDVRPANLPPPAPPLHDEIDYAVAAGGLLWLAWHFLS